MNSVILQPTGNKDAKTHFEETINSYVELGKLKKYLDKNDIQKLKSIYPDEKIYIWGVTPGEKQVNVNKWNKIKQGDVTLFSADKKIFASAVTTYKVHNKQLAGYLWGTNNKGQTWEYIYFIDELARIDISYEEFNKVVGYKSKNIIQGFGVLNQEKSQKLMEYFEIDSDVYGEAINYDEYKSEIEKLISKESLDNKSTGTSRKEQSFLRKYLFKGKKICKCGICGKELPIELLVTAHIKQRSKCTLEERLDVKNIVMPMCKLGCDDLYEHGYLLVEQGIIMRNEEKVFTKDIDNCISSFENSKCSYWNENTEKYFTAHNDKFLRK
ncbi:hypothetical protein psyc5s11_30500 [Clostridium gelidum]|uniref:HNH endonuclease n=1 Tax=Clostridium gelidum TaxID=704125 RepID=A0ABN6IZX4_9CLOT|nr:hypothetical protein [Clostridium gelidum]BCZ46983.1 hypothetical protein psyc5s11_30500 [Clostridium gelidum]